MSEYLLQISFMLGIHKNEKQKQLKDNTEIFLRRKRDESIEKEYNHSLDSKLR